MKNNTGFTLVEILITMAVIFVASFGSFIAFNQFNNFQNLNNSHENFKNALNRTRSNTLSQVINKCNTSQIFVGHQIRLNTLTNPDSYTLEEVCQNAGGSEPSYILQRFTLPSGISFTSAPANPILFLVLTGNVRNPATITLTNGTQTKSVTVNASGVIE